MLRVLILVAIVIGLALWLLKGRRTDRSGTGAPPPGPAARPGTPAPMVTCVHCGVHLPRPEAVLDADGRTYCGEAHRVAGPQ